MAKESLIDDHLDPRITDQMSTSLPKNFLVENIRRSKQQSPPPSKLNQSTKINKSLFPTLNDTTFKKWFRNVLISHIRSLLLFLFGFLLSLLSLLIDRVNFFQGPKCSYCQWSHQTSKDSILSCRWLFVFRRRWHVLLLVDHTLSSLLLQRFTPTLHSFLLLLIYEFLG